MDFNIAERSSWETLIPGQALVGNQTSKPALLPWQTGEALLFFRFQLIDDISGITECDGDKPES